MESRSLPSAPQDASISTRRRATRSFEALSKCAGDANIRVVIVTGAGPGVFVRHYSIPELIGFAESVRATGREWPEARFIDGPISVCESMPKPVIAAISGTCLAGAFEVTLSCDLRIAEDGDYQIGFPEPNFGLVPGAGHAAISTHDSASA
jgi:enoyl-CoA hydratase/carnithine racemase